MNTLITRCLATTDIAPISQFPAILLSDQENAMVKWILTFQMRYGGPPSMERFMAEFIEFVPIKSRAPLPDLVEECMTRKKQLASTMAASELLAGEADPATVAQLLLAKLNCQMSDVIYFSTFDRATYFTSGEPFWFMSNRINDIVGGILPGELAYIVGRLGTGKTLLTQWMIYQWWKAGKRVLLTSAEMTPSQLMLRLDGFIAGINPADVRRRKITGPEPFAMVSHLASIAGGDIIIPTRTPRTPSEIGSLIISHRPDIVAVDGVYLLDSDERLASSWERMASISRGLKGLTLAHKVPLVGTSQANRSARDKVTGYDIAYSDAFGQDADLIAALTTTGRRTRLEVIKNRSAAGVVTDVTVDFDTMRIVEEDEEVIDLEAL